MTEVVYPPALARRVLAGEAGGGAPSRVAVVVPTITRPGEPFTVKLAVVDAAGLPSVAFDGAVSVRLPDAPQEVVEVAFAAGSPAVAQIRGVRLAGEGLVRLEAELDGRDFASNPTACRRDGEPIYWGDPHVHTYLSDCGPRRGRSLNFCYVAAEWLSGLDWVAAADHVSWGRCSVGKWLDQAATSNAFDQPGRFATLPAYEASLDGGLGGDNNVYMARWPETWIDVWDEKGDTKDLCRRMGELLDDGEFFIVPHHTTRTGKHGEIPAAIYPGARMMPVMEIHSDWGTSEYRGNPNPLKEVHPGPSYAVDLLAQALPLGFVAGTDSHATMPSWHTPGEPEHIDRLPGLTAVRSGELTRAGVFGAIRRRNCYAASLERVYLDVRIAGAPGGQAVAWPDPARPRPIVVTAAARSDITAIEVVRNGATIARDEPGAWRGRLDLADDADLTGQWLDDANGWVAPARNGRPGRFATYYVRVTCASGAQGWSSPVWVTRP